MFNVINRYLKGLAYASFLWMATSSLQAATHNVSVGVGAPWFGVRYYYDLGNTWNILGAASFLGTEEGSRVYKGELGMRKVLVGFTAKKSAMQSLFLDFGLSVIHVDLVEHEPDDSDNFWVRLFRDSFNLNRILNEKLDNGTRIHPFIALGVSGQAFEIIYSSLQLKLYFSNEVYFIPELQFGVGVGW